MRSIRIESGNGRSISEELQTSMNLLEAATISYGVNVLVADADEDAATLVLHGARIRFTAGYPLRDRFEKKNMFQTTSQRDRYLFNVGALRLASVGGARAR
jgi:hypothetical protein